MDIKSLHQRRQFILFVLTGGFAALVNFASRILFSHWMSFSVAIVVAYLCGMLTAFVLNRLFVFREANNALHHQVFWFTIVNLAAVVQTLIVSLLLAEWIFPRIQFQWYPQTVAHAIGVAVPVLTSFIGHKHLSFRSR
jgi:putative flippase GtrA